MLIQIDIIFFSKYVFLRIISVHNLLHIKFGLANVRKSVVRLRTFAKPNLIREILLVGIDKLYALS